ncbi:MAG: hypothetical protein CL927_11775 [Deltaproteobacteria bacterium]|nr:hypothetical protein [Deltaproteobacteria bacterium]
MDGFTGTPMLRLAGSQRPRALSEDQMGCYPTHGSTIGWMWFVLLCAWWAFAAAPAAAGVGPFVIDPNHPREVLDGHIEVLFDETGLLERSDVERSTEWRPVGPQPYAKGLDIGVVWLRFQIHNPTPEVVSHVLQVGEGRVDEMTLWLSEGDESVTRHDAGEDVARHDRAFDHLFPLFPLSIEAGGSVSVLGRMVDEGTMNLDVTLSTPAALQDHLEVRAWVSGLMAGTFSLVALYALVVYRRVRDPMMGWMAALALASLFQWVTVDGSGLSAWVPPESRGWTSNRLIVVAYELSAFCSFFFYLTAAQVDRNHPKVAMVVKGFGWFGLANAVAVFFIPFVLGVHILYLGAIGLVMMAVGVVWRGRSGDRLAKRLVFAVSVVVTGYLAALLTEEGLLPRAWISGHFISIATFVQWFLLSEALAFRLRQIEEQRRDAERAQRDEEQRTEEIRNAFGRYVAPDLAAKLLNDPDAMALGGRAQTVTILMSDLRGFTGLTDRLGPSEMCALLNDYLGRMTEVIDRHGGIVNEFIGDAILTLFGTPYPGLEDELDACRCAIEMQVVLEQMNGTLEAEHGIRLEMGIGIHTGEVVVGNIGSNRRVKWGVIGDPVNMTGRIESLTVGTQVLISARMLDRVAGAVSTGGVRSVYVKGRNRTLEVAELRAIPGEDLTMPTPATRDERPRAVALDGSVQIFAGKELIGRDYAVDVVALDGSEVIFQGERPFRVGTNLALKVRQSNEWTTPIYAKTLDKGLPTEDGRLEMRATITWMEPEVRHSLMGAAS